LTTAQSRQRATHGEISRGVRQTRVVGGSSASSVSSRSSPAMTVEASTTGS
jgi:hypothetical protein